MIVVFVDNVLPRSGANDDEDAAMFLARPVLEITLMLSLTSEYVCIKSDVFDAGPHVGSG